MQNDLLKNAIADAKMVRQTALANAKLRMEEAFTPRLQSMISNKLKNESDDTEVDETEDNLDTEPSPDTVATEQPVEPKKNPTDAVQSTAKPKPVGDTQPAPAPAPAPAPETDEVGDDVNTDDIDVDIDDEDSEFDIESDPELNDEGLDLDLESIIKELDDQADIDDEYVEEPELNENESEEEGGELGTESYDYDDTSDEDTIQVDENGNVEVDDDDFRDNDDDGDDDEIDLDEILRELNSEDSGDDDEDNNFASNVKKDNLTNEILRSNVSKLKKSLSEHRNVIKFLKSKLNEVNLLNAKLLFTSKLFKSNNMTNSQKMKVVESFDRAKTLREVKLVYSTISESITNRYKQERPAKMSSISERFGGASKPLLFENLKSKTFSNDIISEGIVSIEGAERLKKLAGIKDKKTI